MRRLALLLPLLAACGSVDGKKACTTSASCGAGSYCAQTPDGAVCWPDAAPPTVGGVTVTCNTDPCERDATLTVSATAGDDAELAAVEVRLDLDPATAVPLARAGAVWTAQLPLRAWPFAVFERAVVATATARDGAGNEASASAAPVAVTRLRWAVEAKVGSTASLSPPAVQADGTVVVGNASHELLFLTPAGGEAAEALAVGAGPISGVAVGERAIWVGSEDNAVRAVKLDRSAVLAGVTVNVDGPIKGGLAVKNEATEEWAFAGGEGGRLGGASTTVPLFATSSVSSYVGGPVVTSAGRICGSTWSAPSLLKCFAFDGALSEDWSTGVGANVVASPALDDTGNIWTGSSDSKLHKTDESGTTLPPTTLPNGIVESPVVLTSGEVVVGDQGSGLHRYTSSATAVWTPAKTLDGIPLTPLALTGGPARLLVGTRNGWVYALADDGTTLWSEQIAPGVTLKGTNISLPSTATPVTSTAYFSASNGKVYAVVVDGTLDTASPWPKAFHDRRNTSNAGTAQ